MAVKQSESRRNDMMAEGAWWLLLMSGLAAVFFGIAAIFWPGLTLLTLVYLFSAFVLVWGVIEIVRGFLDIGRHDTWWLSLIVGFIGLGIGIYLVRHPGVSFTTLIIIIGLLLIGRGLFDIIGAFVGPGEKRHRPMAIIIGAAAILAGIVLLFQSPEAGVAFVWILGLYTLVYGSLNIGMAIAARNRWSENGDRGGM